jgi:thioredoxin 1
MKIRDWLLAGLAFFRLLDLSRHSVAQTSPSNQGLSVSSFSLTEATMPSRICHLRETNFRQEVFDFSEENNYLPILVLFYQFGVSPVLIQQVRSTLEEIAEDYDGWVKVCQINVEPSSPITNRFDVRSTPVTIIFRRDSEMARFYGNVPKTVLVKAAGLPLTPPR